MSRELISVDANGVSTFAHFNADGDVEAIEHIDDVESVLEANLQMRLDGTGGYSKSREWKRVASVPLVLCAKWENEMGLPQGFLMTREGFDILLKKINDPDYGKLRTDK